jgi:hypothetical protein
MYDSTSGASPAAAASAAGGKNDTTISLPSTTAVTATGAPGEV